MADYNLNAHFGATDDISPALSQIISGLQAAAAASAAFNNAASQNASQAQQGFNRAGQAAQQMGQQAQASAGQTAAAAGGIGQMGQAASGAAVNIGSLNVTLTQSGQAASQAQSMYLSLGAALNQLPGPIGNLASGFAMLHGRISETNAGILAATTTVGIMTSALAGGIGNAIEAGMQFQRTFAEVQVVTQATAEQMHQLQDAAIQIGVTTQFNAQQAAQGLYELGSAGFTASESIKALTPITTAAMLGNRSLGDTTKDVVAGLRQFGMGADETTHLVDVMTLAVQGSVVHWNEIGGLWDNLRGRMGQLRIPMEDVVAAEMLMTNSGMSAAQASTAIGTAVDRLSKQTRETAQGLQELGLNVFNAQGEFVGLLNIYQQLEARLPTMTVAQQAHAMAMLGGSRAAGAFLNILQQQQAVMIDGQQVTLKGVELFDHWTQTLRNADGASERAAAIMRDTLDVQLKILHGSIGEAAIRLGTQFLPALQAIVPQLTNTINLFVAAPPSIHAMTAAASAAAVAFGTWTAAVGVWSAMMNTSFGPALLAARGALVGLIPQLALVVAASAALGLAWEHDWGNIREHTKEATDAVGGYLGDLNRDLAVTADYLGRIKVPELGKLSLELPGVAGLKELGDTFGGAAAIAGFTDIGSKLGEAVITGMKTAIVASPLGPLFQIAMGIDEVKTWLHSQIPGMQQELRALMTPEQIALEQAGELDAMAFGAVAKIKQGADLESAAMSALWDQVTKASEQGIDKTGLSTQENLDLVVARVKEIAAKGGHDIGYILAQNIASSGSQVQDTINALMKEAGGDINKALNAAIGMGDQIVATQLMTTQAQHKVIQSALADSSAAYRAQIDIMERAEGPIRALNQKNSDGHLTLNQYNAAMVGVVRSSREEAKATDELEKSLKALNAAMTPGQKLYEQHAQGVVQGITGGLSIDARARLADFAHGRTAQEQLAQMVQAAGAPGVTLTDLYYGTPKQNEERIALLAAALQGGAIDKLSPLAKATGTQTGTQYTSGVAEGIKNQQSAAQQAAAETGAAAAEALTGSLKTGLTNTGAIAQQFANDLANGLDFSAAQERLNNALIVDPEHYRQGGQAAGQAEAEGVAAGIEAGAPAADNAAQTLATGVRLALEGMLTPDLAARLVGRFFEQLPAAIDAQVPGLSTAILGTLTNALLAAVAPGTLVAGLGTALAGRIAEAISSGEETVGQAINDVLSRALGSTVLTLPGTLTGNVAAQIITGLSNLGDEVAKHIRADIDLAQSGVALAEGIATSVQDALGPQVSKAVVLGLTGALNPGLLLTQFSATYLQIGADIVGGIVQGIKNAAPGAAEEAGNALGGFVQGIKDRLGIKSPSTVAAEQIGVPLAQGVAMGFASAMPGVAQTMGDQIQDAVAGIGQTLQTSLAGLPSRGRGLYSVAGTGGVVGQLLGGLGEPDQQGTNETITKIRDAVEDGVESAMDPALRTLLTSGPRIGIGGPGSAPIGPLRGTWEETGYGVGAPGGYRFVPHVAGSEEIQQFIENNPQFAPIYGPRQDELAQYNRMRELLQGRATVNVGGRQVPAVIPYSNTTPNFLNQQLVNMQPMPTEIVGYRPPTQAEARGVLEPRGQIGLFGQRIYDPIEEARRVIPPGQYENVQATAQRYQAQGIEAGPAFNLALDDMARVIVEEAQAMRQTRRQLAAPDPGVQQAYVEQRQALRDAAAETRAWAREVQASGASAEDQVRQFGQYADELTPLRIATTNLGGSAQTTTQYISRLGELTQQNASSFSQVGDITVGLGNALDTTTAAASDFSTRGLGVLGQNATRLGGTFLSIEQRGQLLMQANGLMIDEFGRLKSTLVNVTQGLSDVAESTTDLEATFQSAGDIFAGEGGPGLSSGFADKFFNMVDALLPGNVNPSDYYSPAGFGNGFQPYQPFPGRIPPGTAQNAAMAFSNLFAANGMGGVMPAAMGNALWMMGPGAGINPTTGMIEAPGQAMPLDLLLQSGLASNGSQLAYQGSSTQRWLQDNFNIPAGTISTQSFNDRVAQIMASRVLGGGSQSVNASGMTAAGFLDAARLAGYSGGATAQGGGTGGSGFARANLEYPVVNGVLQPDLVRSQSLQAQAAQNDQYNAMIQQQAKDLANNVALVSLSWSSIADISKYIAGSIAGVSGAFSAMQIDLNSKMASSITGAFVQPTFGGPSGPMPVMGAGAQGISYGATSAAALNALYNQVAAENPGASQSTLSDILAQRMRTDQGYIAIVGKTTETTSDLEQRQNQLKDRIFALQSEANQLGSAYAQGIGVMDQLNAAQAELAAVAAQMAGSVSAPPVNSGNVNYVDPLSQGQPMPQKPPEGAGPGHWVVGAYGTGWAWLPDPPTPVTATTGGIGTNMALPVTGTTTGTTGGTTTPTTPAINPNAPVLVGRTATEDIYRYPNGSIKRVPRGSTPPGGVPPAPVNTTPTTTPSAITRPTVPEQIIPFREEVDAIVGSAGSPTRAAGVSAVSVGDVHVTVNAAGGNITDPIVIAKAGKLFREEMRRSGAFMARQRN